MKRQRLDLHLVPLFGDYPLNKISGFDIERYKHQRQREAVSVRQRSKTIVRAADKITSAKPGTINRELALLSHLFNKAVEWGWMDRRPAKISRFNEGHGRITFVQAGVDLPTVKRISGHKTLAMVERYSHQNGTHIQAAVDKLQARFRLAP